MTTSRLGLDGCRAGWIAFSVSPHQLHHHLLETRQQLLALLNDASLTFIDMPIGLSDSEASRRCDRLLRQALGPNFRSSVFNPPVRAAVYSDSYFEACDRNAAVTGKKISKQSWNITAKIRLLDGLLQQHPPLRETVLESHPEFLFFQLNGGRSLLNKKKTPAGKEERLAILERCWPGVSSAFGLARSQHLKKQVADDDIVDALGLAIGAHLAHQGGVLSLPSPIDVDSAGIPMGIHYCNRVTAQ
ncbi:MAG: DUF429 domain-containing protein [Synechococcus sp.]